MKVKRDRMERVDVGLKELADKRKKKLGISKTQSYRDIANYVKVTLPNFEDREILITDVDPSKTKKKKRGLNEYMQI